MSSWSRSPDGCYSTRIGDVVPIDPSIVQTQPLWLEVSVRDQGDWDTYEALKAFPGNLSNGPYELSGDWIAIGDIGWYDYSFGSPQYTPADFDRMQINGRLWQDKIKAVWGKPTVEVHRHFLNKIERQLRSHQDKKIVLVTHVLPLVEFTVQPPNRMWNYLNAFLGSRQYGRLALAYAVPYAICGHVHYRRQKM